MEEWTVDLMLGDCLEMMNEIESGSVDLVLTDPPYGTTACAWDTVIPFEPMWAGVKRVLKRNGAAVFTASQPFTSALVMSNPGWFKYEWTWVKNRPTNFAHAKNKPMKKHENVLVFSSGTTVHASQSINRMTYHPQGLIDIAPTTRKKSAGEKTESFFADRPGHREFVRDKTGYPHSILEYPTDMLDLHPTAKPVALMEYLIRTYTDEGEIVLDFTMGSGTTGVAAMNTGRRFIGIETDEGYFDIAKNRITRDYEDDLL